MRLPFGALVIDQIRSGYNINNRKFYQSSILILTFFVYFVYHLTRRPFSIVKSKLHHDNCTDYLLEELDEGEVIVPPNNHTNATDWCNWSPFDTKDANSLLGLLDTCYLVTYAVFMFMAGYVAERSNLRYFLSIGLILCGILCFLFGMTYTFKIHVLYYFIIIQILTGIAQTTGWPAVVTAVGNWFGSAKKGLIFGIWNSHTSFGNIAGAAIAGAFVEINWGLAFFIPGLISIAAALIVFLFLVPSPRDVDLESEKDEEKNVTDIKSEGHSAISFIGALKIPGVVEFSICLFFAKLVSYTFLYWLPLYISESTKSSSSESAYLSISFDIGGCIGAILAGYVADRSGASAITCIVMLIAAIPSLFFYYLWGTKNTVINEILQFIAGIFVNGPYSLITTAVSTELAIKVTSKSSLATVSAIIDGTGSIGAAIGPFLAGVVSKWGWNYVFYMVMLADLLAVLSLVRIGLNDFVRLKNSLTAKKVRIIV